jgi:hypothetical protein
MLANQVFNEHLTKLNPVLEMLGLAGAIQAGFSNSNTEAISHPWDARPVCPSASVSLRRALPGSWSRHACLGTQGKTQPSLRGHVRDASGSKVSAFDQPSLSSGYILPRQVTVTGVSERRSEIS